MFYRKKSHRDDAADNGLPDETAVLADIRYFESRLTELVAPLSERDRARTQVYRLLLRQRRQLLAAIRDGMPERWPEYVLADNARDG